MQASNEKTKNLSESPFVLIEKDSQHNQVEFPHAQSQSWDFQIESGSKSVEFTIVANTEHAALSDLVPIAHKVCNRINDLATQDQAKSGKHISCKKGCASCCSYMVPLSSAEAFYLQKHILSLPHEKRRPILHSFLLAARKIAANKRPPTDTTGMDEKESLRAISQWYQSMRIKCPFIENNACSHYQVRPLACREFMVTSQPKACSPFAEEPTEVVHLPVSTAEVLMHISNRLEKKVDEAVLLPLAMVWCNANAERGEKKYPVENLAREFINAISTTPAMA